MSGPAPIARPLLDLAFCRRGGQTVFARRMFNWPFVLTRTFALDPAPSHMLTVIVQTSAGAIHGEDRLDQSISVAPGAAVHVTTPGAAAVHRAHHGDRTQESVRLRIENGGHLEYLPEPRILFPGAAMATTLDIDCARNGVALVCDGFGVHDPGQQGGGFRALESAVILRREGGPPIMADRLRLGAIEPRHFHRHTCYGTFLMVAPLDAESLAEMAKQLSGALAEEPDLYAAASVLPEAAGIGVRLAARTMQAFRTGQDIAWRFLREKTTGHAPARPLGMPTFTAAAER